MSSTVIELADLRRIAEEEKKKAAARNRAKYLKRKITPGYEKDKEYQREYRRKNRAHQAIVDAATVERKKVQKAGRPRPDYCEVCSSPGRIQFDHCHNSGKFRGWLCSKCNSVLGYVDDDPVRLEKLAVYLRTHNA